MDLYIIKLLFDAGLLVLIWMVQLVVYPSFLYYEKQNLVNWHKRYTFGLSILVIPLMFGQLIIACMQWFHAPTINTSISLMLIITVWLCTFVYFVPIHNKIAANSANRHILKHLVSYNWLRTVLWTFIFLWSIYTNF